MSYKRHYVNFKRVVEESDHPKCVAKINANLNNIRSIVLNSMNGRDGPQWVTPLGQSHIYRLLDAAQIEQNICTIVQNEPIPESHLRPLTKLRDNPDGSAGGQRTLAFPFEYDNIQHEKNNGKDLWFSIFLGICRNRITGIMFNIIQL